MKIHAAVLLCLFVGIASAQSTIRPGGGGGSSTITAGTTATSGCTDLSVLSSNGSLVVCPGWAKQATSGAWTIGSSSLGTSVVPLTVTPGTGSTAKLLDLTSSAGTSLSYFDSTGALTFGSSSTQTVTGNGGRIFMTAANQISLGEGVSKYFTVDANLGSAKARYLGLTAGFDTTATPSTYLLANGTGVLQLGADANGAAVNQTLKAHDGITGTDISGANLTIAAGRGTGAGSGGSLYFQTAPLGSTGTTAQTLTTVLTLPKSGGIQVATGTKPACASGIRGTIYYVAGGAGVLDTLEVCRKDAADAYAWVTLF